MRLATTFALVLCLAGLVGAGDPPASPPVAADSVGASTLAFGLDLYRIIKVGGKNVLISPYSITTAMAMARAGARGETASQMEQVLHLPAGAPPAAHAALRRALMPRTVRDGHRRDAKQVPAFQLEIANALWLADDLAGVEAEFQKRLIDGFDAPAERIDFHQTEAARALINNWVAKHTHNRIRNIIPEDLPTPGTRLVLANAIYFHAAWAQPFEKDFTRAAPFHSAGGAVSVPMMHRTETFSYGENASAQLLELPYRGGDTSMVLILPRKRDGLAALEKALTAKNLKTWLDAMRHTSVDVALPRFKFDCPTNLTDTLEQMGMQDAFTSGRADFSGITEKERLFISAVLHKAFIAVDEAGTEAAAATVVMMLKGLPPSDGKSFTADHPFLFLIKHRKTGAILFMGCVETP